ncbi:MAG: hypothetical protein HOP14_13560 [Acidobacteria bacterium]|nr:hypothetical protein [Acidobacteriota bacterium]
MSTRHSTRRATPWLALAAAAVLCASADRVLSAQAAQDTAQTPRAAALADLTGYWVSVVTEEWLWRMRTPPKGDYISVPLSEAGREVADAWDPATDGSCKAYGAGGLMRMPTRLRITWEGDDVLKVETDAGAQTRRLRFEAPAQPGPQSLQGLSLAAWEPNGGPPVMRGGARIGAPAPEGGTLKVVTSNLSEGWLRKNGVAYSDSTTMLEYFDRVSFPNGDDFLIVSSVVQDPRYLLSEYTTSYHFKREADGSKWAPAACRPIE